MSQQAGAAAPASSRGLSGTAVATVFLAALIAALAMRGYDFYVLDLEARRDHGDFRLLSPTGWLGQAYGMVGAGLIFANLAYLIRRRLGHRPLGSMRGWMDMHVVTGLSGFVMVSFHSAFQFRSGLAVAAASSLIIVTLTGVIGRWFYVLAPRVDPRLFDAALRSVNEVAPELGDRIGKALHALGPVTPPPPGAGVIRTLATIPSWMADAHARRVTIQEQMLADPAAHDPRLRWHLHVRCVEVARLARRQVTSTGAIHLLRVWRPMHRLAALIMLAAAALHIGVAWYYGYRWIWSE